MIRQVTLNKANRLKDKSVSIQLITSLEQTTPEFMEVDELVGKEGLVYFSTKAISEEQIKEIDKVDLKPIEGKSLSQRLRDVLYVYHVQNGGSEKTFKDYYAKSMESIIQRFKNQLD